MVNCEGPAERWSYREDSETSSLIASSSRQNISTYMAESPLSNCESSPASGGPSFASDEPYPASDESSPASGESSPASGMPSPASDECSAAAPTSLSWPQRRLLACLSAGSLLAGCCLAVQAPFYSYEAHQRGLSYAATSAVFSCYSFTQLLAFPAMGWLAPRVGVTRLYTLGLLLAGVTTAGFGLLTYVKRPSAFLAACLTVRAAEAVGTAATETAGRTIVINQFRRRVNTVMGVVEAMIGAGRCLGPALGGILYAGGGYGAPFYTIGVLLLATAAASLFVMPKVTDEASSTDKTVGRQDYGRMLFLVVSTPDNWLIIAAQLIAAINWTALDPGMGPYVYRTLGISPPQLGLFFFGSFGGYALSIPLWGRLSDAVDNTFLLVAGCLAPTALGMFLIPPSPLLGLVPSRPLFGLGMVLREVFQAGAYLPLLALLVRRSAARGLPADMHGQALVSAVFGAANSMGNVVGPIGGGLMTDRLGFPALGTALGAATVAVSLAMAARGLVYHWR